ncbi:MAG: TIGR00341 family protein [Candidatus Binatia bacterium]
MALRLLEMILPEEQGQKAHHVLQGQDVLGVWQESLWNQQLLVKVLFPVEAGEAVLDLLDKHFSLAKGFRIILLPVEASLPRPEQPEEAASTQTEAQFAQDSENQVARISREELYAHITETIDLSWIYFTLVILSAIVAAVGLIHDNMTVIIGAMVIAPLLGPNVALSLATTLGDTDLALRALKAGVVGVLTAFVFSLLAGFAFHVNPQAQEIASRTTVSLGDVVLALASGVAGALSFTTGVPTSLIGVMVAVALLPPLITVGMLLGQGHWPEAGGALMLVLTNVICVNLAGVITFLIQGIRPRTWWEADKAKKATRLAIVLWASLLVVLIGIILLSRRS